MHQGKWCSLLAKVRTTRASQKAIKGERVIILNGEGGCIPRREAAAVDCEIHIDWRGKHAGKQQSRAFSTLPLSIRLLPHICLVSAARCTQQPTEWNTMYSLENNTVGLKWYSGQKEILLSSGCVLTDVVNPTWLKQENAFDDELCQST